MTAITFWTISGRNSKQADCTKQAWRQESARKEVHVFCAGYREDEFEELLCFADHIVFNSPSSFSVLEKERSRPEKA